MAVPQKLLNNGNIHSIFKKMRREAVPKEMDAARFSDPCTAGNVSENGRCGILAKVRSLCSALKEPFLGSIGFPVDSQGLKKVRGEECIAILSSFALLDANLFTVRIDMFGLESDNFTDTEPRRVYGHQQDAMFEIRSSLKKPNDLLDTENCRQPPSVASARNCQIDLGSISPNGHSEEETKAVDRDIKRAPGGVSLGD